MSRQSRSIVMADLAPLLDEKLADGSEVILPVTGESMLPLLRHQVDSVSLVSARAGCLRRYDIALYRRNDGAYILHRIVAIRDQYYLAMGDGQWHSERVDPDQVIAVVRGIWREGRYIACNHPLYQVFVFLWTHLLLFRRHLLRFIIKLTRPEKGERP